MDGFLIFFWGPGFAFSALFISMIFSRERPSKPWPETPRSCGSKPRQDTVVNIPNKAFKEEDYTKGKLVLPSPKNYQRVYTWFFDPSFAM